MRFILALFALLVAGFSPAFAEDEAATAAFSDSQKAAIQQIVKDYLTKEHPEIMRDAVQELQRRDQATAIAKATEAIKANKEKIYSDPGTPVGGNPSGDVTIVEFFDYQCGYCKMSEPFLEKTLKDDKGIRFVYKDFPILGPESTVAAKASLAALRQGTDKYVKFHDALMDKKEHLTDDMIYKTAKDSGLDVEKLKKDMDDEANKKQMQANLTLGNDIGVRGTPFFIIGEKVYPVALQADSLKKAIDDARAAKKD